MTMEIRELSFQYQDRSILKNITFSAKPKDLVCVLGPNGVGKSTLFRCLLGLITSYEGSIEMDGRNIRVMKASQLAKKIAYIPQSHHPTFNLTVLHIVMMGLTVHLRGFSGPTSVHEQTAYAALERLGISHLWNRGYAEISGGERQLALIARAIVQQTTILVMDEPTANLDYGNQMRVMSTVQELAEQGYIVIVSTHNPEHALLYGNQALVMLHGEILELGHPQEVITEELLQKVYGVQVALHDIESQAEKVRVIVPCISRF